MEIYMLRRKPFLKKHNYILAVLLLFFLIAAAGFALLVDISTGSGGYVASTVECKIVISEICTKNETIIADNEEKYRDYIELHNQGEAVSLDGFALTDGRKTSPAFSGITLEPGEHRVFFLSDEITGFALGSAGGDCIQLLDPHGRIVTQANTATLQDDQVMQLENGAYRLSYEASPGFPNTDDGRRAFLTGHEAESPELVISELLIRNEFSLPDENGIYSDVIELHNRSDAPVQLGRYHLSDNSAYRFRYRLPDITLDAGAYLTIYCDSLNYVSDSGNIHANFSLSHGETLTLTGPDGGYTSLTARNAGADLSVSLSQDGTYTDGTPTLGYPNTEDGASSFLASRMDTASPLIISELLLSSAQVPYNGGFYDVVEIYNRSDAPVDTAGWYLSDGGDPYATPLPTGQIGPGEYAVILCSPDTTGFSLSEGETLYLTTPGFSFATVMTCTAGDIGMSIHATDTGYTFGSVTLGYGSGAANHERYRQQQLPNALRISEIMTANLTWLPGEYATTSDWVELYNGSDSEINLSEYALSDDPNDPGCYPLPDQILAPGEYCIVFLKDNPLNLLKGHPVLPFTLSSKGESLYLSKHNSIVDYALIPALESDVSYGRAAGSAAFSQLAEVTPEKENSTAVSPSSSPTALTASGVYDDVEYVDVSLSGYGNIYYTTDCTVPDATSTLYTGPIRLTETTVVRAVCIESGKGTSPVLDLTYVINEYDQLPVVTLVTEPDNLWGYKGIYVGGPNMSSTPPYYGANFWMDWERPATLSLYETDGTGFSIPCGIKIFGAFTRSNPKKSLACMFRDAYGESSLVYPLFGEDSLDSYEALLLRTAGQDWNRAKMRDVMVTSLLNEHTGIDVQKYKPVVLYLNGEYWGIHYIREKINENYIAGHYNVSADTVTVVEYTGWSSPEYRELIAYVRETDFSIQENYDYICTQIDIDSFIDFYAAQLWIANTDAGNVKCYRIGNGKWTWFMFDTDLSFDEYDLNNVRTSFSNQNLDNGTGKVFAVRLMANEEFRDKFLRRLAWQMGEVWTEDNINNRIDTIVQLIGGDVEKDCQRWGYLASKWGTYVDTLRTFAAKRSDYLVPFIQDFFKLSDKEMREYGFTL